MRERAMQIFIAQANIENFRRRLRDATDEATRLLITELLRTEETKLAALQAPPEHPQ